MFTRAVRNELDFLRTSKSIYEAVKDRELVMLSITSDLTLLDVAYPFVLPRTRDVVNVFARKYHEVCGERLIVTSASRPRSEQPRNASPKSVHPTGMAVDFRRPTGECLAWVRQELVLLERQGVLEATEEKHPVHFHVAVLQRGRLAVATATADGILVPDDRDLRAKPRPTTATYAVKKGDNLSTIAKKFGLSAARLKSLNGLKSATIRPGQKLRVK